jgi:hypothetical protein
MWRAAQLAKDFPQLREIGKFVEYQLRRAGLTFHWRRLFLGRPVGGLETNLNHIETTTKRREII